MRDFRHELIPYPQLQLPPLHPGAVDVEIGAGQGLHAIQYCLQNPERTLIAIERTQNKFSSLKRRAENHPHIRNLVPLRADAVSVVTHMLSDKSIERFFLLYPNPYPKQRQANQRWHRHPFITCLHQKLVNGGSLSLATNLEWYASEAVLWLGNSGLFRLLEQRRVFKGERPRTHFEKKYLERGETCFDLRFEKLVQ